MKQLLWMRVSDQDILYEISCVLSDIDEITRECNAVFSPSIAVAAEDVRMSAQQLHEVTQNVVHHLGCRDPLTLERIGAIFSVAASAGGMGPIEFRGYIASVFTQIHRHLEARIQESTSELAIPGNANAGPVGSESNFLLRRAPSQTVPDPASNSAPFDDGDSASEDDFEARSVAVDASGASGGAPAAAAPDSSWRGHVTRAKSSFFGKLDEIAESLDAVFIPQVEDAEEPACDLPLHGDLGAQQRSQAASEPQAPHGRQVPSSAEREASASQGAKGFADVGKGFGKGKGVSQCRAPSSGADGEVAPLACLLGPRGWSNPEPSEKGKGANNSRGLDFSREASQYDAQAGSAHYAGNGTGWAGDGDEDDDEYWDEVPDGYYDENSQIRYDENGQMLIDDRTSGPHAIEAPRADENVRLLEGDGMPAYALIGQAWASRRVVLSEDHRQIFVVECELGDPGAQLDESACFSVADLRQLTRRSAHARHTLALVFEDGTLQLRFSYPEMMESLVRTLAANRRIPVVEGRD